MAYKPVSFLLFRILLPVSLLGATIFRFNGLSFVYASLFLVLPLLHGPTHQTMAGSTGRYLIAVLSLSSLALTAQIIFQAYLGIKSKVEDQPYGYNVPNCSTFEEVARQLGVQRLDNTPFLHIARLILPDIIMFIISLLVFLVCRKLNPAPPPGSLLPTQTVMVPTQTRSKSRFKKYLDDLGDIIAVLLLAATAIIQPAVLTGFYFLTFLVIATWWSFYKGLGLAYARFRVFLLLYSGLHLLTLYLYQFQFFQEVLDPSEFYARLFGMVGIIKTDCAQPWMVEFHSLPWFSYLYPGILLIFYWVIATETRYWCSRSNIPQADQSESETNPPSPSMLRSPNKQPKKRKRRAANERQVAEDPSEERLIDTDDQQAGYRSLDNQKSDTSQPATSGDETDADVTQESRPTIQRSAFKTAFIFVMRQSYILALIVMMIWSITYHSWLTFVFLIASCLIWMIPHCRMTCLHASPIIVLYAEALLLIQYVYEMNLNDKELPIKGDGFNYKEVGLAKYPTPVATLGLQVIFTFSFWLTLRQWRKEVHEGELEELQKGMELEARENGNFQQSGSQSGLERAASSQGRQTPESPRRHDNTAMKKLATFLRDILNKYWIFVCCAMWLTITIIDKVTIYRIVYMILFLVYVLIFQLSYRFWRCILYVYWWVVIVYTMFVLILVYTYQFSAFPGYWQNGTGWSQEVLEDIGLEQYDITGLLFKLVMPTVFLIMIILQVHYFHKPFMKMSSIKLYFNGKSRKLERLDRTDAESESEEEVTEGGTRKKRGFTESMKRYYRKFKAKVRIWYRDLNRLLWRIGEVHIFKAVAFTIMMVSVVHVTALSAIFIVLLAVFLPTRTVRFLMSHICQFWAALVILAKMSFQLNITDTDYTYSNCTTGNTSVYPFNQTINNAVWVGIEKTSDIAYYIKDYIAIVLILALEAIIKVHQRQFYFNPNEDKPKHGIIFTNIKRQDADNGIVDCLKYLANYFFYKFGLEICFIITVITICVRVDAISVIYAVLLGILLLLSRNGCAIIWPVYTIILGVLLPIQYLSSLGIPPGLCEAYPWTDELDKALQEWLYLPDYITTPDPYKLIADFFQLLFVCLQWRVFSIERSASQDVVDGGDNKDIIDDVEKTTENPTHDYITHKKSFLDVIKQAVFMYFFWVTLAILFVAGTSRITFFGLGYLIGCFIFLWYGQDMFMRPLRQLRRMWNGLLGFAFCVILVKTFLQLLGCVYEDELKNACWVVQLFNIVCLRSGINAFNSDDVASEGNQTCSVPYDEAGLSWDGAVFVFLLIQRRIFGSHYFRWVVLELKAQNALASRGAELINWRLIMEVKKRKEDEDAVLKNIKRKMEKIKLRQQRLNMKAITETEDHYESKPDSPTMKEEDGDTFFDAIRGGDYYLFEEISDDEDTVATDDKGDKPATDTLELGREEGEEEERGPDPVDLLTTTLEQGTEAALAKTEDGHTEEDQEEGEEEEKSVRVWEKIKNIFRLIGAFICSIIDSIVVVLNRISRDYRLVARILEKEKNEKKEAIMAQETGGYELEASTSQEQQVVPKKTTSEASLDQPDKQASCHDLTLVHKESWEEAEVDGQKELEEQSRIYRFLSAMYTALISRTELLCYFMMILNMMLSASLLSLPYPFAVFLWGMLSVPRPAKHFWITVITYTEAIALLKYFFQFQFIPWNDDVNQHPFWPPRILGIEQKHNWASMDLALLLMLFVHRSVLKRHGLWRSEEDISEDLKKAEETERSRPGSPLALEDSDEPKVELSVKDDVEGAAASSAEKDSSAAKEASTSKDEDSIKDVDTMETDEEDENGAKGKLKCCGCLYHIKAFYKNITNPDYNATADVYAPMFACDFINFLIIVFGYWAFGPPTGGTGDVTEYISENRIPWPFLVMLILQFVLIVIDRALYLKKNVFGKFVFQVVLVIFVHIWMFFILPVITKRTFVGNVPANLWYFVKCLYFGLSAYQIRCGYPTRILGNFLTKTYSYLNLVLFKGFLLIPFLLELRALMDWIWTDTTLALSNWLQMEDIYANIYVLKCFRTAEEKYPTPRGHPKRAIIKYGFGGLVLFIIIFIIWFPLLLFSFANTVSLSNLPVEGNVKIAVGGFEPLFVMSIQSNEISTFTEAEYETLKSQHRTSNAAQAFLGNYEARDTARLMIMSNSTQPWAISPPSHQNMIKYLSPEDTKEKIYMKFEISLSREPNEGMTAETVSNTFTSEISNQVRRQLASIVNGTSNETVKMENLVPPFLRVKVNGRPTEVKSLSSTKRTVNLTLQSGEATWTGTRVQWWEVRSAAEDDPQEYMVMDTFNDRVAPAGFGFLTGYGIIGLYISFVFVIAQFTQTLTRGQHTTIMFEELPNVDRILRLCLDIYLVRESREFRLEEDLFAKLNFLYRSPQTLILWTKVKQS